MEKQNQSQLYLAFDRDQRIYNQADIFTLRKEDMGKTNQNKFTGSNTARILSNHRNSLPSLQNPTVSAISTPNQNNNYFHSTVNSGYSIENQNSKNLLKSQKLETTTKNQPELEISQNKEKIMNQQEQNDQAQQYSEQRRAESFRDQRSSQKDMQSGENEEHNMENDEVSNYLNNKSRHHGSKEKPVSQHYNMKSMNSSLLNETMQQITFKDQQEYLYMRKSLLAMLDKVYQLFSSLENKRKNLQNLLDFFSQTDNVITDSTKDFGKIKEMVKGISESLLTAAQTEVQLGSRIRENEQNAIILSQVQKHSQNVIQKNQELQQNLDIYRQRIQTLEEENNKQMKLLNIEQKSNDDNQKKVIALEQRVEFILENDINLSLNPSDQLRASLNELLRENQSIKRDLNHQNQHIQSLQGNIQKLNFAMTRLNKQIDNLKKNPVQKIGGPAISDNNPDQQDMNMNKNDDVDLLSNYVIPINLEFRFRGLKSEFSNLLSDVEELGAKIFADTIMAQGKDDKEEDKKEMIKLVGFQFINIRLLSQKLNYIFYQFEKFIRITTQTELVMSVNEQLKNLFNCNRVNLWIVESQTGCIFSYDTQGNQVKSFFNQGIIGQVFNTKKALNVKNARGQPLLYLFGDVREKPEVVQNTIMAPIFTGDKQIRGVLEISNANGQVFGFDEEYFAIIWVGLLDSLLKNISTKELLLYELRYQNMMFDAFESLLYCKSYFNFQIQVKRWISTIFGIQSTLFYFVIDNYMCKFNSETDIQQFQLNYGLAGLVCSHQKGFIINDVKLSSFFNQLVDLTSILPVYAIPIVDKDNNECHAIIEVTLQTKLKYKEEKDQLIDPTQGYFGFQEPVANLFSSFCNLIILSLQNCQFFQDANAKQNISN